MEWSAVLHCRYVKKNKNCSSLLAWYLDLVTSDLIKNNFSEELRAESWLHLLGSAKVRTWRGGIVIPSRRKLGVKKEKKIWIGRVQSKWAVLLRSSWWQEGDLCKLPWSWRLTVSHLGMCSSMRSRLVSLLSF